MAVIEIARIQVRRGQESQTGIPQLDSGELGWAEDTEHLYIGKRIIDGAKDDNNTRILTENDLSRMFAMVIPGGPISTTSSYVYRDERLPDGVADGAFPNVMAANSGVRPVLTVGTKLDQEVSLVDLSVTWPPIDNDITAITNAALKDLYANDTEVYPNMQRILKIPAGSYVVTDTLELPPNTKLVGEGQGLTTLILTNDSVNLMQTVDRDGNEFDAMTNNQAMNPQQIHIEGMTLAFNTGLTSNMSLISLDNVRQGIINSVAFKSLGTQFTDIFSTATTAISLDAGELTSSTVGTMLIGNSKINFSEDGEYYVTGSGDYLDKYARVTSIVPWNSYYIVSTDNPAGDFDFRIPGEAYTFWLYNGAGKGVSIRSKYSGSLGNYNSNNIANSENIQIKDSLFDGLVDCIVATSSTNRVSVDNNVLKNSISGIKLYTESSAAASNGPINCQISNNRFDTVYTTALTVGSNPNMLPSNVISSNNYYTEVGNTVAQYFNGVKDSTIAETGYPVIKFSSLGNVTSNDFFNRREVYTVYYNKLVEGPTNIQDQLSRSAFVPGDSLTTVASFPITNTDQFIEVKYQMVGYSSGVSFLSRKGTVTLNIRAVATATSAASISDTYVYTEEQTQYSGDTTDMTANPGSGYDTLIISSVNTATYTALLSKNINGGNSNLYITGSDEFSGFAAYVVSLVDLGGGSYQFITQSANPQFNYDPTLYPDETWSLLTASTPIFSSVPHISNNYFSLACDTSGSSANDYFNIEYQTNTFQY
jgi:hypothetical protein